MTPKVNLLLLAVSLFILSACGGPAEDPQARTVGEIQTLLKEKRDQVRLLTQEIETLEDSLVAIDPSFAPKFPLVAFETVATQSFQDFASVQATVRAAETATATPEIPGRILRMAFEEGDAIRRGQLVAVLDVESTETQKAELETAAELAKTVYERQKRLWDQNIGSELQYLEAKNNYERIQQQLKNIDISTGKRNVYAPISGTVDQVMMRAGENAMPGAPILSIISTNDLNIVADATENLLSKVTRGQELKVNVDVLDLSFTGRVTRIGKTVDPANRTFEVELSVPRNVQSQLKTNLLAEVEIMDYEADEVMVVSQNHIQQEVNGQRYVFTVTEEDGMTVARKTYITTGESYDNQAIITEGLASGDRIITNGGRGLTDGQPVELSQPSK